MGCVAEGLAFHKFYFTLPKAADAGPLFDDLGAIRNPLNPVHPSFRDALSLRPDVIS